MKRDIWPMRDSVKDYFPLPIEVFSLDLSAAEIATKAIKIASDICIYTNSNITMEEV